MVDSAQWGFSLLYLEGRARVCGYVCVCACVLKRQTTCQHCAQLVLISVSQTERQTASWPVEITRLSGQCVDPGAVYLGSMSMLSEGTPACNVMSF